MMVELVARQVVQVVVLAVQVLLEVVTSQLFLVV
jgi:hypothetical protein